MRTEMEIAEKLHTLREKIRVIEEAREEEMKKAFNKRDYRLLRFLSKEYEIYGFSLSHLEWLLS